MENMGDDNLEPNLDNLLSDNKNPQDELEAILRQSRPEPSRKSGLKLPTAPTQKSGGLLWGIVALAVILLLGTIYFLVWGVGANKGSLVVFLNEDGVNLVIDGRSFGAVDSGFTTELSGGGHTATLTKDGFLESREIFEVERGGETEVAWEVLPIPFIELLASGEGIVQPRLSLDGREVSFWDNVERKFMTANVDDGRISEIFDGRSFSGVSEISWSAAGQALVVRMAGVRTLSNMIDNRSTRGAYIPLGERPTQGPSNYNGVYTWYFDDNQKNAAGWQPVLLNENIRQVAFSADGGSLVYIYDPADNEYSLVVAKPDGEEWVRRIIDLPDLRDAHMTWGPDDRYLIMENANTTYLADLMAQTVSPILEDRVAGSAIEFSPDGDRLAYVANTDGGGRQIKIYDFEQGGNLEISVISQELSESRFAWTSGLTMLFVLPNQTFKEINLETGGERIVPFVGQDIDFEIVHMEYSRAGKTLMLETTKGVFKMRF